MNIAIFIARRLGLGAGPSFSKTIMRIAILAIALSVTVMILATAIVRGFKTSISEKVFGFWGHIHITSSSSPSSYAFEAQPMNKDQIYYPDLGQRGPIYYIEQASNWRGEIQEEERQTQGGLRHIQAFAQKEGIIKTEQQIEGIILRGVGEDYDWSFLKNYLLEGELLDPKSEEKVNQILISEVTARRLSLKVGDDFRIYFVQNGSSQARKYKIKGIFKTGLEEYDRRFALVDLRQIQKLNNWRPYRNYGPDLELHEENLYLKGVTNASFAESRTAIQNYLKAGQIPDFSDSSSQSVIVSSVLAGARGWSLGDTIGLEYLDFGEQKYVYRFIIGAIYQAPANLRWEKTIFVPWQALQGPNYLLSEQVSGFEVFVENIDDLDAFGEYINYNTLMGKDQFANTIKEVEPNIFDWLNLTDMNERIIILLMILVSIINMTTSLMILILERTNMIGLLKAMGASNWSIRQLFLYKAGQIIIYGLFWGNLLGIGLCYLQQSFGLIRLPEDLYYVSVAPVQLEFWPIFLLNLGTLLLTLLVLIIPSWLVASIAPLKAIRFK